MGDKGHEAFVQIRKERGSDLDRVLSKNGEGSKNSTEKDDTSLLSETVAESMWRAMDRARDQSQMRCSQH